MSSYRTITGRRFDVTGFSSKEQGLFTALVEEHGRDPAWAEFSRFWQELLSGVLSKVPADDRTRHPLYRIAQDLELRLGIAQGVVAEPDYRDYLADRIEEKFGSRYRFCKESGIPEAFLSQVLSGKKDFSVQMLRRAAEALGLGLALLPTSDLANLPMSDFSALQQTCAVVGGEVASLGAVRDHLWRIDNPAKRRAALAKETSMFGGVLKEVLSEVDHLPEKRRGEVVFEIIEKKESELDALLTSLRARLAVLADGTKAAEQRRERSLPMI